MTKQGSPEAPTPTRPMLGAGDGPRDILQHLGIFFFISFTSQEEFWGLRGSAMQHTVFREQNSSAEIQVTANHKG